MLQSRPRIFGRLYDRPIFNTLIENKLYFNGFGLNFATEALHQA